MNERNRDSAQPKTRTGQMLLVLWALLGWYAATHTRFAATDAWRGALVIFVALTLYGLARIALALRGTGSQHAADSRPNDSDGPHPR